jgi:hypothetical protein
MGEKVDRTLLQKFNWAEAGCVYPTILRFLGPEAGTFIATEWSETWDRVSGNVSELCTSTPPRDAGGSSSEPPR